LTKNYHIKISVSLPLRVVEKLDKLTTYKGKSRSKYIAGAISQRLEAQNADLLEMDLRQCLAMATARFGNNPRDLLMKEIIVAYLNPVNNEQ